MGNALPKNATPEKIVGEIDEWASTSTNRRARPAVVGHVITRGSKLSLAHVKDITLTALRAGGGDATLGELCGTGPVADINDINEVLKMYGGDNNKDIKCTKTD